MPFDLGLAMRVGALEGRHREIESQALARFKAELKPDGMLFIDDTPPVRWRDI